MASLISYDEYEKLTTTQCPLPPRKYKYINSKSEECFLKTTGWFYRDHFWIKEPNSMNIYPAILKPKEFKKYKLRIQQMRTVDNFLDGFSLTTSVDIYNMLQSSINKDALTPRTKGSIGSAQNITNTSLYAKKFHPKWKERIGFLTVIFRAVLNAYFIITNILYYNSAPEDYQVFVLIVVTIEAILFLISFTRTMYNVYSLLKRVCRGSTTHFQVKNIPDNLRQLGSLSVMRYMPNGESAARLKKRGKEWIHERKADYKFEVKNAHSCKFFVMLRWFIMCVLDIIGPIVAIFSLLFKMAQLNFQFEALGEWRWFEIIGYFGFVNQVAGIRKVRKIEIDAVQHFIFSGSDIKMSEEEALLLDVWWNYTMVSCVANICEEFKFPVYDSIIFWYNLSVRRIQLLFKNHGGMEGHQFIMKGGRLHSKMDVHAYDRKVKDEVDKIIKSDTEALELAEHIENHQVEKTLTTDTNAGDEEENVHHKKVSYVGVAVGDIDDDDDVP